MKQQTVLKPGLMAEVEFLTHIHISPKSSMIKPCCGLLLAIDRQIVVWGFYDFIFEEDWCIVCYLAMQNKCLCVVVLCVKILYTQNFSLWAKFHTFTKRLLHKLKTSWTI